MQKKQRDAASYLTFGAGDRKSLNVAGLYFPSGGMSETVRPGGSDPASSSRQQPASRPEATSQSAKFN
tara:strand:+ start:46 stop:249 length:204 start_codon:yes stop_codon:yes gene_type:complete